MSEVIKYFIFIGITITILISCNNFKDKEIKRVLPVAETEPANSWGDNADDVAIWVDENRRQNSLIIGTQKKEGLAVYDLEGKLLQFIEDGKFNNVDIRYNFALNNKLVDIVAASNRTNNSIALYGVDKNKRRLFNIAARTIHSRLKMVYGLCMYHNELDNTYYVFVTSKNGEIEEWQLIPENGRVDAKFIKSFHLSSQLEGCVADDEQGVLFVGEEDVGVWKFLLDKDDTRSNPILVDSVGSQGNLTAEVEGLALYIASNGEGYLIVSSQGASRFDIYNRKPPHSFVGSFKIVDNEDLNIDKVTGTDGIDVINLRLNDNYKYGLFIAQDDKNRRPRAHQNFKFVPWENIAKPLNLIIDNQYIYWH